MVTIGKEEKWIDWNAIRAEYIGGGTSYRKLAEKHQVSFMVLKTRAKKEGWPGLRTQAEHKANTAAAKRVAEKAADNATIAADLKRSLLLRLKQIEAKYPMDATEVRTRVGNSTAIYRIKDLAAAYHDLTGDMVQGDTTGNELLLSLLKLERGAEVD